MAWVLAEKTTTEALSCLELRELLNLVELVLLGELLLNKLLLVEQSILIVVGCCAIFLEVGVHQEELISTS